MEKKKRSGTRYLTVNGTPWEYRIGRATVAIYDPEGKRYFPRLIEIRKNWEVPLNPATILNYILTEILGDSPIHHKCVCCKVIKADVYSRPNPFAYEIHGDKTKHYFCNNCVNDRAEEI